jgi:hypothetical protein
VSAVLSEHPADRPQVSPSWGRLLLALIVGGGIAGLLMLAVGSVFDKIEAAIPSIPAEYENKAVFRLWPGWTERYMLVHPLWFGFVFTLGFLLLARARLQWSWSGAAGGGAWYGALLFLVGSMPIFALLYASFQVSLELVAVSWAARNLAQYLGAGCFLGLVTRLFLGKVSDPKTH